jgi:multidrug efflux pump subunit AcrA (membrane-fusion protein)
MKQNLSAILPQDPPSWVVRAIAWLLCALAVTAALVAVTVRIPETVRCPFTLVSQSGAETVLAPIQAALRELKVEEGDEVARGATLFVLRSDEIRGWDTQRQTAREDLRALDERGGKLDQAYVAQLAIKDAQIVQMQRETAFREKHLATTKDYVSRNERLAADGIVSKVDLLKYQLSLAESEKDLLISQKTLLQAGLELDQMKTERARQRLDEQTEAKKLRIRLAALGQQLENCEGDLMFIRAPYDAAVVVLRQRGPGNLVHAGEPLCQLARRDDRPRARLQLVESGLSRLQAKQPVRFFFDAFPYQRYGSVTGQLDWISPAAQSAPGTPQFTALASLDQTALGGAGKPRPLRVGMKGEARVRVGTRTLIEQAFEPIRQLRENIRQ